MVSEMRIRLSVDVDVVRLAGGRGRREIRHENFSFHCVLRRHFRLCPPPAGCRYYHLRIMTPLDLRGLRTTEFLCCFNF